MINSIAPSKPAALLTALERLLPSVQKPARYLGHEINAVHKDPAKVKVHVGLAFPDVYEVGMSHLGLKILYSIVNGQPDFYAERVFAPWTDMEAVMRENHTPLTTLETGTPLSELDLLGFSLQVPNFVPQTSSRCSISLIFPCIPRTGGLKIRS